MSLEREIGEMRESLPRLQELKGARTWAKYSEEVIGINDRLRRRYMRLAKLVREHPRLEFITIGARTLVDLNRHILHMCAVSEEYRRHWCNV